MKEIFAALRIETKFDHENEFQEVKLVSDEDYGFNHFETYKQAEDWIKERGVKGQLYQIQKFFVCK